MSKPITINSTTNIDEIMSSLNKQDKEDLYRALRINLGKTNDISLGIPATMCLYEKEMLAAILEIWRVRHNLSPNQRNKLIAMAQENFS